MAYIFLVYCGQVSAGNTSTGLISFLHFMNDGSVLFTSSGNHNHLATDQECVLTQPSNWGLNASTDQGKAQLSGLLMAYAQKKSIVVYGTGYCTAHPSRETVNYFYIVD